MRFRKVGQVPYGRTILAMQLIAALTFVGYTLAKKDVDLPLGSEPYYVEVMFPDAKGLQPSKEPAAGVAGVVAGKVVGVETENGQARVTLRLDPEMRGKVFADASATVRPTSALQTLMVNVLPGDPDTGPLRDGEPIGAGNTEAFVHVDELSGVLDADTQAQVQTLVTEADLALRGRDREVRAILGELGALTDGATPLAEALADRRRQVAELTRGLDKLFATVGARGEQLAGAIEAGRRTLDVTAARGPELAAATRQLAPVLRQASDSLVSTQAIAEPLDSALAELTPAADSIGPGARELAALTPEIDSFMAEAEGLVEEGSEPMHLLAKGSEGIGERVRDDQIPATKDLAELVGLLHEYQTGVVQFSENMSALLSANRNGGTYVPYNIVGIEFSPEGFGLPLGEANERIGPDGETRLGVLFAQALERACKDNATACAIRFGLPGLPKEPLAGSADGEGDR